jgi:hypothetical protein
MNNRVLQIVLIALAGALLAWWLMRDGEESPAPSAYSAAAPSSAGPATREANVGAPQAAPPKVRFQLPKMASPKGEAPPTTPKAPTTIHIPRDWQLRGSGSKNYELRSDRDTVFAGNYSAVLIAHDKNVSPNLSGSGIQSVLAAPYVGTRVELSAMLRGEGLRTAGALWIYATDPSRVIVGYQVTQMSPRADPSEWARYRVVMDIPFHAEVLAYGFTLQGQGKLWADDVHLRIVDADTPLTGPLNAHQIGVIAQAVSVEGALADPANLDFEDVQVTRERQPPPPPDEINATRF